MDKAIEALIKGAGKISESLDNAKLPIWAKGVGQALLLGLTTTFLLCVASLAGEYIKTGVMNYQGVALVIGTFFTATVLGAIYGALKLLVDTNNNGIPDELERKDDENAGSRH